MTLLFQYFLSDLMIAGEWDSLNRVKQLDNFSSGLVTKEGVFYVVVQDASKYKQFYQKWHGEGASMLVEIQYRNKYGIKEELTASEAIVPFSRLLNDYDTGLVLSYKLNNQNKFSYTDSIGNSKNCD